MAVIPAAVVVDTADGYVFWRDSTGLTGLFDEASAEAFAARRNKNLHDDAPRCIVAALTPVTDYQQQQCFRCGVAIIPRVEEVWLDGQDRNDCPESEDGAPHEPDPPEGWHD